MLRTKNIITDFSELDELWCYEHYLRPHGLNEKLQGQSVNMLSPFNQENTPSFFLFYEGRYFFKDYSSGFSGDCYSLVQHLFNIPTKAEAITRVWNTYEDYLNDTNNTLQTHSYTETKMSKKTKYHIKDVIMRKWAMRDKEYWLDKYGINRKLLEDHNVAPLEKIIMNKVTNEGVSSFDIVNELAYGFYNKQGLISHIYRPGIKPKFFRVRNFLQGGDQQDPNNTKLLITKSLKDALTFKTLELPDWNVVAPQSETELLSKEIMEELKARYSTIKVLFDNDNAGRQAESLYKKEYDLDAVGFDMGYKDLSDTKEALKLGAVRAEMKKLLGIKDELYAA